jgi:hypothetical protein
MSRLSPAQLWDLLAKDGKQTGPRPPDRKKRSREESIMQTHLIEWWHLNCRHFGVPEILLASCPNGGGRSGPRVGAILKAEGLRAGFPDLGLYVPRRPRPIGMTTTPHYSGLFLELKCREGVVSPEQEVFHELLQAQGYKVCVVRTLQDAINQITLYLT